jgi:hypothetical protein
LGYTTQTEQKTSSKPIFLASGEQYRFPACNHIPYSKKARQMQNHKNKGG